MLWPGDDKATWSALVSGMRERRWRIQKEENKDMIVTWQGQRITDFDDFSQLPPSKEIPPSSRLLKWPLPDYEHIQSRREL